MRNSRIDIRPIAGSLGAEISGVDLSEDLDDGLFDEVRQALLDHLVIFFRNQDLTPDQQLRAGQINSMQVKDPGDDVQTVSGHPLVRTHPGTGRKALYIGNHVDHIKGMTTEESEPLLGYLERHSIRPELTCRFRWRKGSLAFWDNRCTQHNAINDYPAETRIMHRITLRGDTPS